MKNNYNFFQPYYDLGRNEILKMIKEQIEEIVHNRIKECKSILELKKILFKISQEVYGEKTTAGIRKEIKDTITIKDLIELGNNFTTPKEKMELIELVELENLSYENAEKIFEGDNLLQAIKKYGIKISKENLQELYKTTNSKNKEFIQSLLDMEITDKETVTEMVIKNVDSEKVIDYIKNNNLTLTKTQFDDLQTRFNNIEISEENRRFFNTISDLLERNDELLTTINYQIIGNRYESLDKYLPILTCYPELQDKIQSLTDKELKTFSMCLDSYSQKTQDWMPVFVNMLDNIGQYSKLIEHNTEYSESQNENKIQLLTKLISEPNYFKIDNTDEYLAKKENICNLILNNSNSKELQQYEQIYSMTEQERIKFAILEKNYGLSLEQSKELIRKFGDDIDSISGLSKKAGYYKGLINSIKFICDEKNINQISKIIFNSTNNSLNSNMLEREMKDIYDKDYVKQLYRPLEDDLEREEDGIKIYKAGKSTNGKFLMETHSPGAIYADEDLKSGNFKKAWNKPKIKSQAFCTVTSRQDMLIATNTPFLEYGFYNFEEGSLRASGYEDIYSDATMPIIFADNDEKYCSSDVKVNKTRNINENDRSRIMTDGTKKQPDYIKFRKTRFMPPQMAERIWNNSKKAAQQFGIPIVIVDQDECSKRENYELQDMLQELKQNKNPNLIEQIIVKFENNRMGNNFGKQKGKPINTDFEIEANQGETSTITRNGMLKDIITVINECKYVEQKKELYRALDVAINNEIEKFKKPRNKSFK